MNTQKINRLVQEMCNGQASPGLHDGSSFTLDNEQDTKYPEQHIAITQASSNIFAVSMAILDPSPIFDPNKNFETNVQEICAKDYKRARRYRGRNDFIRAYSAGAHTMLDETKEKGIQPSYLVFDTVVWFDEAKNDASMMLLSVGERPINSRRSYSFSNFTNENEGDSFHQDCLNATYNLFEKGAETVETNEIFLSALGKPISYKQYDFGTTVASMASAIIICAAGARTNLYAFVPFLVRVYEMEDEKAVKYMTRAKYLDKTNDDICAIQLTAPFRDPAAAYNLLQFKKFHTAGQTVEGNRQAEKAVVFLNEQKANFRLPQSQNRCRPS